MEWIVDGFFWFLKTFLWLTLLSIVGLAIRGFWRILTKEKED